TPSVRTRATAIWVVARWRPSNSIYNLLSKKVNYTGGKMMSQQALYWEEFQRFVQKGYADWQILEGETITHRIFGSGRIISVDSDRSLIVQYSVERIEYQISQLRTEFQPLRLSQRLLELNPKILETLRARTYVRESKSKSLANLNSSPRSVPLIELSRL